MTRVIDFDAFRAEQTSEPLELRVNGNTYELPSSLPASLALDIIRLNSADSSAEYAPSTLVVMGEGIFGADLFRRVLDENQITMVELPELFRLVFTAYSGEPELPNPESSPQSEQTETTSA